MAARCRTTSKGTLLTKELIEKIAYFNRLDPIDRISIIPEVKDKGKPL